MDLHPLLRRQLRRLGLTEEAMAKGPELHALLETVSRTYGDADQDRYTMERSLSISSGELRQLNDNLRRSSETRLAEERDKLAKSLAIHEATIEASADGVLVVGADRRVVSFNARFVELWELPEEVLATASDERLLGHVLAQLSEPAEFLARVSYLYEHPDESSDEQISLADGRTLERHSAPVVGGSGASYGRVWFFRDVTDRKRSDDSLREANRFLDSIFEHIPAMAFIKDAATLRFVRINRAAEQLLGWGREDLIGRCDHDFFPAEQADAFTSRDREVLSGTGPVHIEEEQIQTRADGIRLLSTKKIPIRDRDGAPAFLLGISEDVTALRQKESELRQAMEAAQKASRAKSDFLRNMSHSLRTPLNSILGFARVISRQAAASLGEGQRGYLQQIERAGTHMLQLVDDLLDLRSLEDRDLHAAPLELTPLLHESVGMVRPLIDEKRLRVSVVVADALPSVFAERRAIVQILINLISNAAKFTPQGGAIALSAAQDGACVRVAVSDTGIGIAERDQPRLFTYFEQLGVRQAQQLKGSGVGLALTRALVEKQGGSIEVESKVGLGTTFRFSLKVSA